MRTRGWMAVVGMMLALCMMTSVSAAATTYTDPQGRFSFAVPDGYQQTDAGEGRIAYYSPTYARANVIVSSFTGASATNLDDTAAAILKTIGDTLKNFQPGPNGVQTVTIAGKPARRYEYTAMVGDVHAHGVQYLVVNSTTGYFFTFTASEADFSAFLNESKGILDSFKFLNSTGTGTEATAPTTNPPVASPPAGNPPAATSLRANFIRRLGDG